MMVKKKSKKKLKLKKELKLFIILVCLVVVIGTLMVNRYNVYKYHQTLEYKLTIKGYDDDTIKLIKSKLDSNNLEYVLKEEKTDYIDKLLKEKYFLSKNFIKYMDFYEENSKYSFSDVIAIVNVNASNPWYQDSHETIVRDDYLTLVNKFYLLPETYSNQSIKKFSSAYAYGNVEADEVCYNAFIEMSKAAKADKISLMLTSGYRTYEKQKNVYEEMERDYGSDYASKYAARPGASEHETGLALDIFTPNSTTETFKNTDAYSWLSENASNYGFILRYPEEKEYLTGYNAESWHYRYVGVEVAKQINKENITFDEYYAYYLDK